MKLVPAPIDGTTTWLIDVRAEDASDDNFADALDQALRDVETGGGEEAQLWIHEITDVGDAVAVEAGFVAYRDLWQVRCDLPAQPSSLTTRAFTVEDSAALVAVNNRAFAWHPEQGGMTLDSLAASMAEPWFNADGFRLFERDGDLLGFCWTKIHAEEDPVLGEIYVIAVDPSAHGQGLGTPMTLAGLDWISAQGITHAMLYVESDNDPANATYRRIGFTHHHTDRAYTRTITS